MGWGPPPNPGSVEPGRGVREPSRLGARWRPGGVRGQPPPAWAGRQVDGSRSRRRPRRRARPPPPGRGPRCSPAVGRHKMAAAAASPGTLAHAAAAVRSCVYFAEWTASRCPGSERCRGRWKFLWIKHGAEARGLFGLAALPPHPVPGPHSSPGVRSRRSPGPSSSLAPAAQSRAAATPSPSLEEACFSGVTSPMAGWGAPLSSGSSCRRGGRRCTDQASHVWGPCPWVQHQKMPGTQAGLQKGLRCLSGEALHPDETWAFREGREGVLGYRIDLPGLREQGARISGELCPQAEGAASGTPVG